jgi:hypothetical protein
MLGRSGGQSPHPSLIVGEGLQPDSRPPPIQILRIIDEIRTESVSRHGEPCAVYLRQPGILADSIFQVAASAGRYLTVRHRGRQSEGRDRRPISRRPAERTSARFLPPVVGARCG